MIGVLRKRPDKRGGTSWNSGTGLHKGLLKVRGYFSDHCIYDLILAHQLPSEEEPRLAGHWSWHLKALLVIVATLALLHLTNPHVGRFYGEWESVHYVRSVDYPLAHPIDLHYGYRLLPPLLVRLLPVPHPLGFVIIDYFSLIGAAYLLCLILLREKIHRGLAILGAVLFLSFPCSTKWLLAYSSCPDAFYLLLIAVAYRCIQVQRWLCLSVVLLLGVFTKVTLWVLWPVALLYGAQSLRRKFWNKRIGGLSRMAAIFPSLLAFTLVQMIWPSANTGYTLYKYISFHTKLKLFHSSQMLPGILPQVFEVPMAFFVVFGMVAIILAFNLRQSGQVLINHPPMLVFFLGTMAVSFMGSYTSARCQMYLAIPVLYVFFKVVQAQWVFYSQWRVALPLITIQVYLSDFFVWNIANFPAYMPHFMPPAIALKYLGVWTGAALLLAGLMHFWFIQDFYGTPSSLGGCKVSRICPDWSAARSGEE